MADPPVLIPPDHHVHTEWSWDAEHGDMERTCARALELGLPSVAFTEHADWVRGPACVVDLDGYLECVERCRARFSGLRILSGVELGEPHRHLEETRTLLARAPLDRVLGSVHTIRWQGGEQDASKPGFLDPATVDDQYRAYLGDTRRMLEGDVRFSVLAHLDYPKRYWPEGARPYDVARFEAELRAVLRAAAGAGVALEVNTTRGGPAERYLCPGPDVVRWWVEEGGRTIAFGSDAHSPDKLAAGFREAAAMVEAAGFRAQDDPHAFWTR